MSCSCLGSAWSQGITLATLLARVRYLRLFFDSGACDPCLFMIVSNLALIFRFVVVMSLRPKDASTTWACAVAIGSSQLTLLTRF